MTSSAPDQSDSDETTATFEDLKRQDVPSDFIIKVGVKSIPTHQINLNLHSEYFRAMLTHDTKEKQQGFVEMKNVSLDGMRECIEFMYTGETNINNETVESILQAADMIKLLKVKKECLGYLDGNLELYNCVSTLYLVSKYSCPDLQNKSQKMFDEYFDITLPELLEMSMEDLTEYYESHTFTNEIAWDGILNWIKYEAENRSDFVFKLVEMLNWDEFPSGILLRILWSNSLFRNSKPCGELLFEKLFLDLEIFEANLSVENYFILEKLSREFKYVIKQFKVTLSLYFKRNIIRLSPPRDLIRMGSIEILSLFSEAKHEIFAPEKWWWNTAILWVNKKSRRKKLFPRLMRSIRFDRLPRFFVDTVVRKEPMVTKSKKCLQILIDALYTDVIEKETEASLVLLYSDGRIRSLKLESRYQEWKYLTSEGLTGQSRIIFYFNGKLCLMSDTMLFYLHNNKWIKKCSIPPNSISKMFCTLDEFIYLIVGKKIICYNSLADTWSETALPHNLGEKYSVAALDGSFYTFGNRQIRKFKAEKKVWSDVSTIAQNPTLAATVGKKIYTCAYGFYVDIFDPDKGSESWQHFHLQNNFKYSRKEAKFQVVEDSTAIKFVFDLRGRVVVMTKKSIYIYNNVCNEWQFIEDFPKHEAGTTNRQPTVNVESACLTFKDVNYAPHSLKRQKLN